jgi:hypothetical protein
MGVRRVLNFCGSLFDFKNIDSILMGEINKGKLAGGVLRYFFGVFFTVFTGFALATLAIVYLMVAYNAMSGTSLVVTATPSITSGFLESSLVYFGLITFPFLFFGSFLHQGIVYLVMRLMGGRGAFAIQYSITSYLTFALGFGALGFIPVFVISLFLPCFNLFFLLTYLTATAYLALFVQAKMLANVHRVQYMSALVICLLISIGSLAAYGLLELALIKAGIGPDFQASFSLPGINTSSLGVNMGGLPQLGSMPNISSNTTVISGLVNTTNLTNTTG